MQTITIYTLLLGGCIAFVLTGHTGFGVAFFVSACIVQVEESK